MSLRKRRKSCCAARLRGGHIQAFVAGKTDLVLGGIFADLAFAQRVKLPRGTLHFDPASGLFGLVPVHAGGDLDKPEIRRLLSGAINRNSFVAALGVPELAPRATVLEPGLDGAPPRRQLRRGSRPRSTRGARCCSPKQPGYSADHKPTIRVGASRRSRRRPFCQELSRDWGALGFPVERAATPASGRFPPGRRGAHPNRGHWFVRQFRCESTPMCETPTPTH